MSGLYLEVMLMTPTISRVIPRAVLTAAILLSLTACGGGGGTKSDAPIVTPPIGGGGNGGGDGGGDGNGGGTGGNGGGTGGDGGGSGGGDNGGDDPAPQPPKEPELIGWNDGFDPLTRPQVLADSIDTGYQWKWGYNWGMAGGAEARAAGFTGKGVRVGMADGQYLGASYNSPTAHLNVNYQDFRNSPELEAEDAVQRDHGHHVAAVLAGKEMGLFPGGIAPNVDFYWARTCEADTCYGDAAHAAVIAWGEIGGVDIINWSFGTSLARDNDAERKLYADGYARMAASATYDALFVVAAGNDAFDTASSPADLPLLYPEYESRWMAVVAANVEDGVVVGLDDYSNQCGLAMNWCIAAPATNRMTASDSEPGANYVAGTSLATPFVSGVAALVKENFGWMTASNLQTTIFTTAVDMGDAGVDEVWGWGVVDAYGALKGPGQFLADFTANVDGDYHSVFSNDISGGGGLVKDGQGALYLAGKNTYTGQTLVQGGTLGLMGDVAGDVSVSGATFQSMGGKVGGNFSVDATGVTGIAVGQPLLIGGNANLDGELHLRGTVDGYNVTGKSPELLLSAGSVNGAFNDVTYGSGLFYTADIAYSDKDVKADLHRVEGAASAVSAGLSSVVVSGARVADGVLDGFAGGAVGSASFNDGFFSVVNSDLSVASASLASISGFEHGAQRTVAMQSALNDLHLAADHAPRLIRSADTFAMWIKTDRQDGTFDRDGFAKMDYQQDGYALGFDLRMDNTDMVIGGSVIAGRVKGDAGAVGGRFESKRKGLTGYVYQPLGIGYVSGILSGIDGNVDTRRNAIIGSVNEQLVSERDETVFAGRIEMGFATNVGFNPYVGLGAIRHEQGSFAEASDSGFGLIAGSDSDTVLFGEAGVRLMGGVDAWTWNASFGYRNIFDGNNMNFDARFGGLEGVGVTIEGMPVSRDAFRVSLGGAWQINAQAQLFGRVGAERGSSRLDNAQLDVGLRMTF